MNVKSIFSKFIWTLKSWYYRSKLTLWAVTHVPHTLFIADTQYSVPAWHWQVAIPLRTTTTQRKANRMFYEPEDIPRFKDLVKGKTVFFDIGANIGHYSYLAAANGIKKIVAFEFTPAYSLFIQKGFAANKIPAVVVARGVGNPGEYSAYADPLASASGKLISLDAYAKNTGVYPDVIKMDIEGYELDALRNAHEVLLRKPAIDISIHPVFLKYRGQSAKEVLDLLGGYGYKVIWSGGDTYFMKAE